MKQSARFASRAKSALREGNVSRANNMARAAKKAENREARKVSQD